MDIGRVICALRKESNLTQEEVAFTAGTDAGYLSRIERGDRYPSIALLENIAKALGTKPSSIYAAAENIEQSTTANELENAFSTDLSDEAVNLRLAFKELSKANRLVAVELLRALKKTQS
jgi:transcriptional regulator with XRE-family HTH domain